MYLREGESQKEISRVTGIDRTTVRKYIKQWFMTICESLKNSLLKQKKSIQMAC